MKIPGLLEVIQVQRHDFLNHLQVISGLVQLNKTERVQDYIKKVCEEMGSFGIISKLPVPELQAVLFIAINEASKHQVEFKFDIKSKLDDCTVPGNIIGEAVEECINQAMKYLSPPQIEDRCLLLSVIEQEKKIYCKFGLPGLSAEAVVGLKDELNYCPILSDYGIKVGLLVKSERAEIYLSLPRESL